MAIGSGSDAWFSFAKTPDARRVWLWEMEAFSLAPSVGESGAFGDGAFSQLAFGGYSEDFAVAGTTTLRYSTDGFTSSPTDQVPSQHWEARLEAIRLDAEVGGEQLRGPVRVLSEVELANGDGALDGLTNNYALDGRPCTLLMGDPSWPRLAAAQPYYIPVFQGEISRVEVTEARLRISAANGFDCLDYPIALSFYDASAANTALMHLPRPLCYGQVFNIAPVLVEPSGLVYQVHDGPIEDVTAVYDRGVALTRVAASPALGEFAVDTAGGFILLGGPPDGTVTADVKGCKRGGSYLSRSADIIQRILVEHGWPQAGIDTLDILDTDVYAWGTVGYYTGTEPRTTAEVVQALAEGAGTFYWVGADGLFHIQRLRSSGGSPFATFDAEELIEVERLALPGSVDPVCSRIVVDYARNWTPQNDLAESVLPTRRGAAAVEVSAAVVEDPGVRSRHRLARELHAGGWWAEHATAQAFAQQIFDLWGVPRLLLRGRAGMAGMLLEIGDMVSLTHARFGLEDTHSGIVLGKGFDNARPGEVELKVLMLDPDTVWGLY